MRNVSENSGREKTYFLRSITFFPENHAIYEIMWKNVVDPGRPQMPFWCMCIGCWITKAKTCSECSIFIAFPLQQWLHNCTSMFIIIIIIMFMKG
jgi:hypothetical protein